MKNTFHASGFLVIDKPPGISSAEVVGRVKRRLQADKVGHLGTLDPFAVGVLTLAVNRATRLIPFLEGGSKAYQAELKLGEATDTEDYTGQVSARMEVTETHLAGIPAALAALRGVIAQVPPMYSAVKKDGERLYKLARRGLEVERPARPVTIYELKLSRLNPPYLALLVECSPGTYIRTLAAELGKKLGCGAHLTALRRIRDGHFSLAQAVHLAALTPDRAAAIWTEKAIVPEQALAFLPAAEVKPEALSWIKNGRPLKAEMVKNEFLTGYKNEDLVSLKFCGKLIAVARLLASGDDLLSGNKITMKIEWTDFTVLNEFLYNDQDI